MGVGEEVDPRGRETVGIGKVEVGQPGSAGRTAGKKINRSPIRVLKGETAVERSGADLGNAASAPALGPHGGCPAGFFNIEF